MATTERITFSKKSEQGCQKKAQDFAKWPLLINNHSHALLFPVAPDVLASSLLSPVFDSIFSMKTALWDCLEWWQHWLGWHMEASPNESAPTYPKGVNWAINWRYLLRQKLCNNLPWLPYCLGTHSWTPIPVVAAVPTQNRKGTAASS